MTRAEKHIRHFNNLHGKSITKDKLRGFLNDIRADIAAGRIDIHAPYGLEVKGIEKRLSTALDKMNGHSFVEKLSITKVKIRDYNALKLLAEKRMKAAQAKKKAQVNKPALVKKVAVKPKQKEPVKPKSIKGLCGFTTADQAPELKNTFTLPGEIGKFIGLQQRYQLAITITGEYGSSKSEFVNQLANAFLDAGFSTVMVDLEKGGLSSKDTKASIDRNISPENKKKLVVGSELEEPKMESLQALAGQFDVVILDSGTKMDEPSNKWVDTLRKKFPNTIWVIVFQRNSQKRISGGASAEFDAPVAFESVRADWTTHTRNYVKANKNRGNRTNVWYMITQRQTTDQEPLTKKI